jgi:nicotinate phosphoribosyltransferase
MEFLNIGKSPISDFNSALLTDFYEVVMAAAYFESGQLHRIGLFEMFTRKLPRNRKYLIAAGLEQVIQYLLNFRFRPEHITFLKSQKVLSHISDNFFDYLLSLRFTGDVWAVPEGTIVFPNEPIIRVEAPLIEAQIIETYLLSVMNFQTLIASKASRIVHAAAGRPVIEYGSRRAHGPNASVLAARASFIGGCQATSNTLAAYKMNIPVSGTMAHSFIMNFDTEEEGLLTFSQVFPSSTLLIDTYDPVQAVAKIKSMGIDVAAVRIDSGDILTVSKTVRKLLDDAGYTSTKIMASGDLNESTIYELLSKSAPIDFFGVGTELSTSRDDPALDGSYKLVAIKIKSNDEKKIQLRYRQKLSSGKHTYPGPKQVFRILRGGKIERDILTLEGDTIDGASPLLTEYINQGRLIQTLPSMIEIQATCKDQIKTLPDTYIDLRLESQASPLVVSDKLKRIIVGDTY